MTRVERHAGRLRRDAKRLGLTQPPRAEIERLLVETARESFGRGDGIVRIEWSRRGEGPPTLRASTRPLPGHPEQWRARTARTQHPGPEDRHHTKRIDVAAYDLGRRETQDAGVDEVLLLDACGWLVEGAHSSCLVVNRAGELLTPELALGAVESLGLEIVRESTPGLRSARIDLAALREARELIAVNAVRGVVPIVELDGIPVDRGRPGPWARRLRALFETS